MPSATMTTKGQTVIPKPVRDLLGLQPGDQVDFVVQDDRTVLLRPATQDVRRLRGLLYKPGRKAVSLEDMQAAIVRRGGRAR